MTQDELIKCGCWFTDTGALVTDDIDLNAFAKLVAEKEREACAKTCETLGVHPALNVWGGGSDWYKHGKDCASAIRERGQA